jgi:hypothetical protein
MTSLCLASKSFRLRLPATLSNLDALCDRQNKFPNAYLCTSTTRKTTSDRMHTRIASARSSGTIPDRQLFLAQEYPAVYA